MPLKLVALYGALGSGVDEIVNKLCRRGYVLLPGCASTVEPEEVMARWTCVTNVHESGKKYVVRLKYVNEYIAANCLTFTCVYIKSTWMERFKRLQKTRFPPSKISMKYRDEEDLQYYDHTKLFKIIV